MSPVEQVVLFDDSCGLCTGLVRFICQRDKRAVFRFAPIQSQKGRELCLQHGIDPQRPEGVVLATAKGVLVGSDAILAIAGELQGLWRLVTFFRIVPRRVRDRVYKLIAQNRYRWFGRVASCPIPDEELRRRFLQ